MSDFFMSNNEDLQQDNELDRIKKQKEEYLAQQQEEARRRDRERLENRQMFGVELNDDEYAQINKLIADSPDYEQEAHRIGSALLLARNFDTDFTDAYVNIDNYSQALYGKTEPVTDYKNFFGVVKDSIMIGTNGLTLGNLGNRLKAAEIDNDTELVNKILEEIDLINKDNELRQDNAPRSWITEQIRDGMQTLPFSAQAAGLAFFGNFVLPGAGTALSFASTSAITAGQEYIDLREKGVSPEVARKVSDISGGIQGLIEVSLGEALDYGIAGATKKLTKTASGKIAQKATEKFAKLFHYGNDAKLIADILGAKALNVTGEGLEEAAQQIVSIGGRHIAESMEGLDLSEDTIQSITQEITDAFRGGVVGAIVLGLPFDVANANADIKNYKFVKQQAKETQSFEMFYENNKDNPVFKNIKEDQRREYIKDVWKQAQSENEAEINLRAKEYGEVLGTENFEQSDVDEETGDETIEAEYREDTGELHTQNVVVSEDDGVVKGIFGVGDPTKQNDNKYAEINYTADEQNKTVTIDSLKVGKSRQNLRNEVYDSFARTFPGYEIQWNAIGKVAQEWKQQFTEANPQGKNAGLNYYQSVDDIADASTRRQVVSQIKQAYQKAGKTLTDKQLEADTVILESLYRRLREQQDFKDRGIDSFSKYVSYTFGNNIFGESDKVTQAAQQQYGEGVKAQGASIPRSLQELDQDIKAVVYVTENGDFSTFSHEIAHIARKQLTGDLLKQVEDALGVTDGNWTVDKEEKFAYGFEQFLREGKVENEALRPFYEKVAQFLVDCLTRLKNVIQMTPDIEKVYNELLAKGDEGTLAAAERAVKEEENAARQAEKKRQQEAEAQKKAEEQQQQVTEEDQNIEDSEVMFTEEQNNTVTSDTVPDNDTQATEDNQVRKTLDNTNLPEEVKTDIEDVLNDEESSQIEKTEAADEAAEDSYQFDIFQLIGEMGATNLDRVEEVTTRMDNLATAREMEVAGKEAKTIRLATGWEKGVDGKWRYEINDLNFKFDLIYKELDFIKNNPRIVELRNKLHNILNGGEGLTAAEITELDELTDIANKKSEQEAVELRDILDAPELYAAYPELKRLSVIFRYDPSNTTLASLAEGEDLFNNIKMDLIIINNLINEDNQQKYNNILLHEIQHYIQEKEGFAKGGDPNTVTKEAQILKDDFDLVWFYNELLDKYKSDKDKYRYNQIALLEDVVNDFNESGFSEMLPDERIKSKAFNRWVTDKGVEEELKLLELNGLDKHLPSSKITSSDLINYKRLAGEVESRNVQKRQNMTVEERLNTLLSETEDVNRSDQIVLFQAMQMAEEEVAIKNLWQGSEDMREYGFDDGSKDVEKNVPNNRKLLEITYDENGYLIPLSKRFNPNDSSILFQTETAEEKDLRKQYENTDKWLKAPNGKESNLTEKQWLQVRTPAFKNYFGDWENDPANASKVLDENGEPKVVYHGTARGDRVGNVFDPKRATSGPMAFFTDSKDIAISYSKNKVDTSLSRDYENYDDISRFTIKIGRSRYNLGNAWYALDPAVRVKLRENAAKVTFDEDSNIVFDENNEDGTGNFKYILSENKGNVLKALYEHWISSGNLFGERVKELPTVLKLAGLDNVFYEDPDYREEKVYDVYLNLRNPFLTADITESDKAYIEKAAAKAQRKYDPNKATFADNWDKTNVSPSEWLEDLNSDIENGTTYAWTRVPDFVTKALLELGYDGIEDTGGKHGGDTHTVYIPFNSYQIKSATDNRGTFDAEKKNILFQTEDPTLYGVHNLSEDALKHVLDIGGLANPSFAVVDKNIGAFTNFGNISLIAYSSTINKATGGNTGTYGADIYSPRYPRINVEITDKGNDTIKKLVSNIEYDNLLSTVKNKIINFVESNESYGSNEAFAVPFLIEQGEKDFYVIPKLTVNEEEKAFYDKVQDHVYDVLDMTEEEKKELSDMYLNAQMEERKTKYPDLTEKQYKVMQKLLLDEETGLVNHNLISNYWWTIRDNIKNAGNIKEYDTIKKAAELATSEKYGEKFNLWKKEKIDSIDKNERIFNGYTPSGNRRYLAHTLENVSKYMKQQATRGGEGFNYGMGSARALVTPKFSTLAQISAAKDRLTDKASFEAAKEKLEDEYNWIGKKLRGSISDYDAGYARYAESIEKGYFDANYIKREYNDVSLSDEDIQRITEFTKAMKEMPTEYFETKWDKPIYVENFGNTFAAAVLPKNTDEKLVNELENKGILIYKYENEEDHDRIILEALDDVNKTRKVLFQTQAELYADARTFPTWQEFMDFYETMGKPDVTPIPYDADAQWYQTTWELANKVTPEESIIQEELTQKYAGEDQTPKSLDSYFVATIVEDDDNLRDFLNTLSMYDSIDLNSDEWQQAETREDAEERQRIADLQSYMKTVMYSRSWRQAMASLKAGNEVTNIDLRNIRGEMRDDFKARDFRALYYAVTGDELYKVEDKDLVSTMMKNRYDKHPERYYDIVKADEDFTNYSPEKRKQISKDMDNADLAADIRSGKLKMDDKVHDYIKLLDKQIAGLQKQLTDQEIEAENDYKLIADVERRELLKLHDKMLLAKGKYQGTNDEITKKLNKGIRISSKYSRENQNLKANYDELYRKFQDLKSLVVIDSQVEAALKRQEAIHQIKEDISTKQAEKSRAAEEKKLRVQLVKRAMRRIDFKKIDYEDAKTIIAIQRIFEPNLMGGVNRWIGTEGPFLRGVISGILTDVEYKESIEKYLQNHAKASKAYLDFVELLRNTKTLEDFNKWTQKDRKAAIRYLPKENWIQDLNLVKLAKEREESIDLDINTVEKQKPVIDPKTGQQKTYKDQDGESKGAYTTAFILEYSDEIAQRVRDAVGADMYDNMVNVPFADWTFEQLEELATRINELYIRGRDTLEGKKLARKEAADKIRNSIESAVKNTGIIINDDDDDETKKRKLAKINKILGLEDNNTKGSEAGKDQGFKARINRILHSYNDANVLRVARILDGYTEGTNYQELYRKEDTCYVNKTRSMNERAKNIQKVMQENNITPADLATVIQVKVPSFNGKTENVVQEYTIDDLLYFLAASKDYATNDNGSYDQYAACSRNAVMYGNMFASAADLEAKQQMAEDETVDVTGQSVAQQSYIGRCQARFEKVLEAAEALDPKYKALLEAIQDDYAAQYERMNEVSINVFNSPVHRVKCYVPLVRLESNGDTNTNKVREDLLAAMGANATRQGVNKGMTQRRVRMNPFNQKPVETGLYKTWTNSVERTEHFIAYSQYVDELNRVYKSRDAQFTRQFIENRYGKGMIKYIDDYINEVANPNANKIREAGAELLHTFRGRTAPAYLAWKASAIVKQGLTSPWPFMQYINPAEYLAASWKAITSKGEVYKAIKEKSVYMNNRVMDPINDLIDEMAEYGKTKFDRIMGKQSQIGMKGLEWIDWVCVAPGWYAAYEKEYARLNGNNQAVYEAEKERLTEENLYAEVGTSAWKTPEQIEALAQKAMEDDVEARAVQYADDITRACQPSNRAVDLAPLFKNSSEAMKAYLQFQTSLNVIWQNIKYDTQYIAKKPDAVAKEQFMQISGIIIGYALAGILMNSVMEGVGGDDEDEKLKNLIYYATTQFTDAVPMIGGELTNTMDKLITGKASYQSTGTDLTPTVTKILSILTNAKKGNWDKAAQMTAEGMGMYFGLPVSGLKEIEKITGIGDKEQGLDVDLSKVYGILGSEE